ncbi:MAG: cobalamin-dependent protein [Paenisporosarcina sp.]|nr:cobalamin-dependent protein [Paenisporosarcina sp.]
MTPKDLVNAFIEGKSDEAFIQIEKLYSGGLSVASIYQNYVTEAMQLIGVMWEEDEISVADEHLATSTCDFVLAKFHSRVKKIPITEISKKAMFFSVEKEQHSLGMKMAAHLFEQAGWDVRFMGANLPLTYAVDAAERFKPDVIGISLTIIHHLEQLKTYVERLESIQSRPQLLVGSRLISSYELSEYASPATRMIRNFEVLDEWMKEYDGVIPHVTH